MSIKRLSTKQAEIETDDLLTEILIRLPSHSVYRFKTICKYWHSLFTSPEFRKLRSRRLNVNPPTGLILQYSNTNNGKMCNEVVSFWSNKSKTTIIMPSLQVELIIQQSCNGLLLCTTGSRYHEYHVYNPTANTYVTLPSIPSLIGYNAKLRTMSLAFDPKVSSYYKVISRLYVSKRSIYHIYSSDTRCWTLIPDSDFLCNQTTYFKCEGIYCNGSINWIHALLSFNIENHTQKAMPAPLLPLWDRVYYFGESCGRLNYTSLRWSSPCTVDVYELKSDYSRWTLKYSVILRNCRYYTTKVLSVVHGTKEGDDDSFLVLKTREKIVKYNLVSKTSEELHIVPPGIYYIRAFQHFESMSGV